MSPSKVWRMVAVYVETDGWIRLLKRLGFTAMIAFVFNLDVWHILIVPGR